MIMKSYRPLPKGVDYDEVRALLWKESYLSVPVLEERLHINSALAEELLEVLIQNGDVHPEATEKGYQVFIPRYE